MALACKLASDDAFINHVGSDCNHFAFHLVSDNKRERGLLQRKAADGSFGDVQVRVAHASLEEMAESPE